MTAGLDSRTVASDAVRICSGGRKVPFVVIWIRVWLE